MPAAFDRDAMAVFYAKRHKETDPAISPIYYFPAGAPANEIRFVEVNKAITNIARPEPIDFGVDGGTDNGHKLIVLDVTPEQWQEIQEDPSLLPPGWTLEGSQEISRGRTRRRSGTKRRNSGGRRS